MLYPPGNSPRCGNPAIYRSFSWGNNGFSASMFVFPYGDLESSTTLFLLPCFSEQCRDRNCPVFVCPSSTGNLNAAGQGTCFMLGNPDVCGHGGHANKHISPARHLLPKLGYDDMICISKKWDNNFNQFRANIIADHATRVRGTLS